MLTLLCVILIYCNTVKQFCQYKDLQFVVENAIIRNNSFIKKHLKGRNIVILFGILPIPVLVVITLVAYVFGEMIKCRYSREEGMGKIYLYTAVVSFVCAALILAFSGFSVQCSAGSIFMGVLFGLAFMAMLVSSAAAMRIGPWAYTTVMMSLATVIPSLSGPVFYGEKITVMQIAGMIMMCVCFLLSVQKDGTQKKANFLWVVYSLIASLGMSGIGLLQKAQQSGAHKDESGMFLFAAFMSAAIVGFVIDKIKRRGEEKSAFGKHNIILCFAAGVATALNHTINLALIGTMDSALFFPLISGAELIMITLASVVFMREKLTIKRWIGLVCGIVATVILCL